MRLTITTGRRPHLPGLGRAGSIAVTAVGAVICALIASVGYDVAAADDSLEGTPIDATTAQTISLAALSCPHLTGPRLTGQLMAATGMDANANAAKTGAAGGTTTGIAGLAPAVFKQWMPWRGASAGDTSASIYALAHHMCNLMGELRFNGVKGDPWRNALAAYHVGVPAVRAANGVPDAAAAYVATVAGYTAWYARQAVFGGPEGAGAPSDSAGANPGVGYGPVAGEPVPVPDAELPAVQAAGRYCPEVTPAKVAASVMAASAFNVNLRSATGAMGVAQLTPHLWDEYSHGVGSPWDPATAIPALGRALCDLSAQLAGMGSDPFRLAVAAYRVGPTAVRQARGVPNLAELREYLDTVAADVEYYAKDGRLGAPVATPPASPSSSPSPSGRPSASPSKSRAPSVAPSPTPTLVKIVNGNSGKVVAPLNHTTDPNGRLVQVTYTGATDQQWRMTDTGGGHVKFSNAASGQVIVIYADSKELSAAVVQWPDLGYNDNHRWKLIDAGGGAYKLRNAMSGLLMAVHAASRDENAAIEQYSDNGTGDHLWKVVAVG